MTILEQLFADCFFVEFNTRLIGGFEEPLYQPEGPAGEPALIQYRSDYFASALHEVAHWCIAGPSRRQQVDYGYWYSPDGRDAQAQRQFELVEFKPQALEWFFAKASGYPFKVSLDNLSENAMNPAQTRHFKQTVLVQAQHWQKNKLPERAYQFFCALQREFFDSHNVSSYQTLKFSTQELDL